MSAIPELPRTAENSSQITGEASLEALLVEELDALSTLLASLAEEHEALVVADPVRIEALVPRKSLEVERASALATRRAARMTALGHRPLDPGCRILWERVKKLWHEAQRSNHTNGAVARLHMGRAARALNVVRQLRSDGSGYRADGRPTGQILHI